MGRISVTDCSERCDLFDQTGCKLLEPRISRIVCLELV